MNKIKRIFFVTPLLLILTSGFFLANAQQRKYQEGLSNRGLVLTPLVTYLEGNKGQTLTGKFQLTNDFQTPGKAEVFPTTANFITDNSGAPIVDSSPRNIDNDFAKWFSIEIPNYTLDHKEIKEFNYTIKIPQNGAGGTHSALILLPRTKDEAQPEAPSAEAKDELVLPVFLTINTDIDFKAQIGDMYVSDIENKKKENFFFGTAKTHVIVENPGNVYLRPFGNVFIHKGDKTKPIKTYEFNPTSTLVQQRNKREYQFEFETNGFITQTLNNEGKVSQKVNWGKFFDFKFGRYYVTYQSRIKPSNEAKLGNDNVIVLEKTVSFYIFPIQIFIIIGIVVLVLVIFILKNKLKSKSKNKRKL